jgi:hypothetical protein
MAARDILVFDRKAVRAHRRRADARFGEHDFPTRSRLGIVVAFCAARFDRLAPKRHAASAAIW